WPASPVILSSLSFAFLLPTPSVPYTLSLHDALPISAGIVLTTDYQHLLEDAGPRGLRLSQVDNGRALQAAGLALTLHDAFLRPRSEEHTSELQSRFDLVCRLLLEKKQYILLYDRRRQ